MFLIFGRRSAFDIALHNVDYRRRRSRTRHPIALLVFIGGGKRSEVLGGGKGLEGKGLEGREKKVLNRRAKKELALFNNNSVRVRAKVTMKPSESSFVPHEGFSRGNANVESEMLKLDVAVWYREKSKVWGTARQMSGTLKQMSRLRGMNPIYPLCA